MGPTRQQEMAVHVAEFNNHVQSYFISSTYGNETLVNRSLEHIATSNEPHALDVSVYENNVFFVNLHKLMSCTGKKNSLLWSAVEVLEMAVTDEETRRALVDKFRYFPLVANLLGDVYGQEQQSRVLHLLHQFSDGTSIDGHEVFVEKLVQKLLQLIDQHTDKCRDVAQLSLSILVNICHRNLAATFVLTKNTNISTFSGQIKQFGMLACKMYIILEQNEYMKVMDLHYLLRMSFKEIGGAMKTKDTISLRHVVDYLRYVKKLNDDQGKPPKVSVEDEYFRKDLQEFVTVIRDHLDECVKRPQTSGQSKGKSKNRNLESPAELLFEILECVVTLKNDEMDFHQTLASIAVKWITGARESCSKAVDLLRMVVDGNPSNAAITDSCRSLLPDLVQIVQNNNDDRLMVAFAKLLVAIVKVMNATDGTIDEAGELFFQQLFGSVLNLPRIGVSFDYSLSDSHTRVYIWGLHAFNELANVSPTMWYAKVTNLLKQKPIHFLIAKGMTSGDGEILEAMLQLASSSDFPRLDVAHMVELLQNNLPLNCTGTGAQNDNSKPPTCGLSTTRALSKDLQERMDQAIGQIQEAKTAGLLNDVSKAELIEFYNYKINLQTHLMNDLRASLESTSSQITTLMHQNQLLMAEIDKSQKKSLPLLLKESALENENRMLEKELGQMKSVTATYDKRTSQMKQELSEYVRKYNEKSQQCSVLSKEIAVLRTRDSNYEKENKRLQQELAASTKARDDSRKLLKLADEERQKLTQQKEADRKACEGKIREREREISKHVDLIQQLEQTLEQRDSEIESRELEAKDLQAKVTDRDERIVKLEAELKESENIQQAIYSLMNKGKK